MDPRYLPEGMVQNKRELFSFQISFGPETRGYRLYTQDGLTPGEPHRFVYLTAGDEKCFHRLTFEHGVADVRLLKTSEWVS
jgi:hypothetical protein